jgi:ribosomal protein S18 acetylase RimI-like enzyme
MKETRLGASSLSALNPAFCVRGMGASDIEFIEPLAERAFGEYSWRPGASTLALAHGPRAIAFIACSGSSRAGFAVLEIHSARDAHLAAIAVLENYRGSGVGRQLLAHVEREAAIRESACLRLVTSQANLAAIDLFLKAGFRIEQRLGRYYSRGQDALLMQKRLSNRHA